MDTNGDSLAIFTKYSLNPMGTPKKEEIPLTTEASRRAVADILSETQASEPVSGDDKDALDAILAVLQTPPSAARMDFVKTSFVGASEGQSAAASLKLLDAAGAVLSIPMRIVSGFTRFVSKTTGLSLEASAAALALVSMGASFALVFLHAPVVAGGALLLMSGLFVAYGGILLGSSPKQRVILPGLEFSDRVPEQRRPLLKEVLSENAKRVLPLVEEALRRYNRSHGRNAALADLNLYAHYFHEGEADYVYQVMIEIDNQRIGVFVAYIDKATRKLVIGANDD